MTPTNPSIPAGRTIAFTATGSFSDGSHQDLTTSVTWSSANVTVATISNVSGSQGIATGQAQGTSQIQAQLNGVVGSTTLTVTDAVLDSIEVTPTNPSIPAGRTIAFTATGSFSDGSHQDLTTSVTWSSANVTVATISNVSGSQGIATGQAQGTSQIQAQLNGIVGLTTLTVTLAPTPTATATATFTPTATATFTPTATATFTPTATATATSTPTATATFTPTATATFTPTATSTFTPTATARLLRQLRQRLLQRLQRRLRLRRRRLLRVRLTRRW